MKRLLRAILALTLLPLLLGACGRGKHEGYEIRSGKVIWNSLRGDGLKGKWYEGIVTDDARGFEILQQKTVEMDGYAKNTQNIYFGPGELAGADVKAFELLDSSGLARDDKHVYRKGAVIENADLVTFRLTEQAHLGRDNKDYY